MGDVIDLSPDEILAVIEDGYDARVAPSSMVREDNNKLHLIFKADAAGYGLLNKAVLALKQRFDPALCSEIDLPDVAAIAGTSFLPGKNSALAVTVTNSDAGNPHTLLAGTYQYRSSSGEIFSFVLDTDTVVTELESLVFYAFSADIGAFAVTDIAVAAITSSLAIDPNFDFSCSNNSAYIGYPAETNLQFRQRVLARNNGDDIVTEIQNAIKALPTIYDCTCLLNATVGSVTYDGITLAAMRSCLICITGIPTADLAKAVVSRGIFLTHEVDAPKVVNYPSALYTGGIFPVFSCTT